MFVYLVLAHHKPGLLVRTVRAIRASSPLATILVHYDSRTALPPELPDGVIVHQSLGQLQWGHWSIVEAILHELGWIRTHLDATHVVIVSGQDYPTRPLAAWENAVDPLDALIQARPIQPSDAVRHLYHWYGLPTSTKWTTRGLPNRVLVAATALLGRRFCYRLLTNDRGALFGIHRPWHGPPVYKGSMWLLLSARAIDLILADHTVRPLFARALIPDESYFHTLLLNDSRMVIQSGEVSFTIWTGQIGEAHPRTLDETDFDLIRGSGAPFARKVEESPLLDRLDAVNR